MAGPDRDAVSLHEFTVFWVGHGQYRVKGRDREHAKLVLYMSIPEAKWNEIR